MTKTKETTAAETTGSRPWRHPLFWGVCLPMLPSALVGVFGWWLLVPPGSGRGGGGCSTDAHEAPAPSCDRGRVACHAGRTRREGDPRRRAASATAGHGTAAARAVAGGQRAQGPGSAAAGDRARPGHPAGPPVTRSAGERPTGYGWWGASTRAGRYQRDRQPSARQYTTVCPAGPPARRPPAPESSCTTSSRSAPGQAPAGGHL